MGGTISVESEYGKGSRFSATLPQEPDGADVLAAVRSPATKRVLVFERQRVCADSIAASLKNLGVRHRIVATRAEFESALAEAAGNEDGGNGTAPVDGCGATDREAGGHKATNRETDGGGATAHAADGGRATDESACGEVAGTNNDAGESAAAAAHVTAGEARTTGEAGTTGEAAGTALRGGHYTHVFVSAALAGEAREALDALFGGDGNRDGGSRSAGGSGKDGGASGFGGDGDNAGNNRDNSDSYGGNRWPDALRPAVVALSGLGDAAALPIGGDVLDMPVHAISIANLLNSADGFSERHEDGESADGQKHPRFTAPGARALVVDDISTNLLVMEGLLEPYGLETDTCLSGKEAIRLALANRYDIVFMDHMMPEMDGIEATAAIRALDGDAGLASVANMANIASVAGTDAAGKPRYADLPIIVLTANAVVGQREMFMRSGFSDFLAKPIELHKLNAALHKWLPAEKKIPLSNSYTSER
jgi:CheY-like chemotaxis protein